MHQAKGCIFLCDIVSFSTKTEQQQANAVSGLARWLEGEVSEKRLRRWPYINSTGDGFLLVVDDNALPGRGSAARWCLALAEKLLAFCERQGARGFGVRIALHHGRYLRPVTAFETDSAVGHALNWCARIAFGEAGHVIATDAFFNQCPARHREQFDPADGNFAEIPAKHGKTAFVTIYRGQGSGSRVNANKPRAIERLERLDRDIEDALHQAMLALLESLRLTKTDDVSIALYVPDRSGNEHGLYCGGYLGETAGWQNVRLTWPSKSGPIAVALHRREAVIACGFPNKVRAEHARAWASKTELGGRSIALDGKAWSRGTRLSGAYLFTGVSPAKEWAEQTKNAVVCLETRAPLSGHLNDPALKKVGRFLRDQCETRVAPLLALRGGI